MSWASKVAPKVNSEETKPKAVASAASNPPATQFNKLGKNVESVTFKPAAANGAIPPNPALLEKNLSFGTIKTRTQDVKQPKPVLANAYNNMQFIARTMSAPPKVAEQDSKFIPQNSGTHYIPSNVKNNSNSNQVKHVNNDVHSKDMNAKSLPQENEEKEALQSTVKPVYQNNRPKVANFPVQNQTMTGPPADIYPNYQNPYDMYAGGVPPQAFYPQNPYANFYPMPMGIPPIPPVTAPVTPKKSAKIIIRNPNTKEEVNLEKIAISTPHPPTPVASKSVSTSQTPVKIVDTSITPAVTPLKVENVVAKPVLKSQAIPIVHPTKNVVLNVEQVIKADKKPMVQKDLPEIIVAKNNIAASIENKVIDHHQTNTLLSPSSIVTSPSVLDSPSMDRESSIQSATISEVDDELEDGEIQDVVAHLLTTTDGIKYPSTISSLPDLRAVVKKYSKDFLMAFANLRIAKPMNLHIDDTYKGEGKGDRRQFSDKRSSHRTSSDYKSSDRYHNDSKSGRTGSSSNRKSGHGPSMNRQGSGDNRGYRQSSYQSNLPQRPSNRNSTYPPEVLEVLVKSENAWNPQAQLKNNSDELVLIERKLKGLLNKLTIEKFDSISDKILHIGIPDMNTLEHVISIIFEKALDEPNFGSMYASLCVKMSCNIFNVESWIEGDARNNDYRKALLKKCQFEFERNAKWSAEDGSSLKERLEKRKQMESLPAEEKLKIAEEDYERSKLKRRVLGNIRFIGELFIKSMIGEGIMHRCVTQMLTNVCDPEEEDIESLCKLLTTIGSTLDHAKAQSHMANYFERIKEVSSNPKLSSRIRFMLLDVIDLRKNKWVGRVEISGPKTIADIHRDAERKAAEEANEKLRISRGGSSRGGSNRNSVVHSGPRRTQDVREVMSRPQKDSFQTAESYVPIKRTVAPPQSLTPGGRISYNTSAKGQQNQSENIVMSGKNSYDILSAMEDKQSESDATEKIVLSKEQIESKTKAMIAEWFSIFDTKEIKLSLEEIGKDSFSFVIDSYLQEVMDKKIICIEKTSALFVTLYEEDIFKAEDFIQGFENQLEFADSMVCDIPKLFSHLGQFYANLILCGAMNLKSLPSMFEKLAVENHKYQLLGETFVAIRNSAGVEGLLNAFKSSSIDLEAYVPKDKYAAWIEKYNLKLLDFMPQISVEILPFFSNVIGDEEVEALQNWMNDSVQSLKHSKGFVKLFTNQCIKYIFSRTFNENRYEVTQQMYLPMVEDLKKFIKLFQECLDCEESQSSQLKLVILEEIEDFWGNVHQPSEFLESLFRLFFEADIVDSSVYYFWQKRCSNKEALKRIVGFIKYMKTLEASD